LINDIDVPKAEARIAAFRAENAALIDLNIQREEQYVQALREQEEAERREREWRAQEARRQEEEEREEREKDRKEIIDRLETSNRDAAKVVAQSRAKAIKRSSARLTATAAVPSQTQLLRSRAAQSTEFPDVPHVPLQDDWYTYDDMFVVKESYDDPFSEAVRQDQEGVMRAGGYRVEEAWERALRSAVAGLNIPPLVGLDSAPLPEKAVIVS
jgi:CDK-activating kinase assembly factor MAT1